MVIGVIRWEIQVYEAQSLKAKRAVVRSLKDRLRSRLNVSVAETGSHDLWQKAELSACALAADRRQLDSILDNADRLVESEVRGRIMGTDRIYY